MKESESKKLAEAGKYLAAGIMDGLQKYCQDVYIAALENEEAIDEAIKEIREDRGGVI